MTAQPGPVVVVGAHVQGLFMRVDAVPRDGETVLGHGFAEPLDAGKATSQAIVAARLGAPVVFVTVLGSDERGRRWRSFLDAEGIDIGWIADAGRSWRAIGLSPGGAAAVRRPRES